MRSDLDHERVALAEGRGLMLRGWVREAGMLVGSTDGDQAGQKVDSGYFFPSQIAAGTD